MFVTDGCHAPRTCARVAYTPERGQQRVLADMLVDGGKPQVAAQALALLHHRFNGIGSAEQLSAQVHVPRPHEVADERGAHDKPVAGYGADDFTPDAALFAQIFQIARHSRAAR